MNYEKKAGYRWNQSRSTTYFFDQAAYELLNIGREISTRAGITGNQFATSGKGKIMEMKRTLVLATIGMYLCAGLASAQQSSSGTSSQQPSSGMSAQQPSSGASGQPSSSGTSTQQPSSGMSTQQPSSGTSSQQKSSGASGQPSSSGASDSAPVAGKAVLGVTVVEMEAIIVGWSANKDLLNKNVVNDKNEKIGKIEDIIITPDNAASFAIIGVGGFLGLGKNDVAIPMKQIKLQGDKLVLPGASKDALKALPKFTYAKK